MLGWSEYKQNIKSNYWDRAIPDWVDRLPSMTHRREKAMLYQVVKDFPDEIGRIVDAGSFGGASTYAFCAALRDRNRPLRDNMIVSYDLFHTDRFSSDVFKQFGLEAPVGSSFLPIFLDIIRGNEDIVSVVKGSILDFGWAGGPIDILFLDVLKSQELHDHCLRSFYPSLVPGKSIVLHQDFLHDPLPWIPLTTAVLEDYFEMLGWCRTTVALRCRKKITVEAVDEALLKIAAMSIAAKEKLYEKVEAHFRDTHPRTNLSLSRLYMTLYHGDLDKVRHGIETFPVTEDWINTKLDRLRAQVAVRD